MAADGFHCGSSSPGAAREAGPTGVSVGALPPPLFVILVK